MRSERKTHFDTSKYPPDYFLHDQTNKKVLGKFKDELQGVPILEFVECCLSNLDVADNSAISLEIGNLVAILDDITCCQSGFGEHQVRCFHSLLGAPRWWHACQVGILMYSGSNKPHLCIINDARDFLLCLTCDGGVEGQVGRVLTSTGPTGHRLTVVPTDTELIWQENTSDRAFAIKS
uniref:Uncharacterized protein n=1 Tax=Strigamia maritima TaxID=126957 RepID=T1IJI6_STRMM